MVINNTWYVCDMCPIVRQKQLGREIITFIIQQSKVGLPYERSHGYINSTFRIRFYDIEGKTTTNINLVGDSMATLFHGIGAGGQFKIPNTGKRKNITKKMSLVTYNIKAKPEIYRGDELCQVKSKELLKEIGLPNGLLPLKDMQECGYDRERGFVWLKQKKSLTHKFDKIGQLVSFANEVSAYVEFCKIKKLTGVKVMELFLWFTLGEIYLDDPPTGKITFKVPEGFVRTFPVSAFEIEEKEVNKYVNGKMEVKVVEVK